MACVSPNGELTPSGRSILEALATPRDAQALADATGLPLYRARSGLREFIEAGLAVESDGQYTVSALGRERLGSS